MDTGSGTRRGQVCSNASSLGSGAGFGDGLRAWRNKSSCSVLGPRPIHAVGASWSTSRKQRPRCRRFAGGWRAASPTEAKRGSAERRHNSAWNRPRVRRTAQGRPSTNYDPANTRACLPSCPVSRPREPLSSALQRLESVPGGLTGEGQIGDVVEVFRAVRSGDSIAVSDPKHVEHVGLQEPARALHVA